MRWYSLKGVPLGSKKGSGAIIRMRINNARGPPRGRHKLYGGSRTPTTLRFLVLRDHLYRALRLTSIRTHEPRRPSPRSRLVRHARTRKKNLTVQFDLRHFSRYPAAVVCVVRDARPRHALAPGSPYPSSTFLQSRVLDDEVETTPPRARCVPHVRDSCPRLCTASSHEM